MRHGPVHNFLLIATMLAMTGCVSSTKRIATQANEVTQRASEISDTADRAMAALSDPPPSLPVDDETTAYLALQKSYWLAVQSNADFINDAAAKIHIDLTKVGDTIPWWATLLKALAALGLFGLLIATAWYTGLLKLVQKFVWGLGLMIPDAKKSQAKLDAEVFDANPESPEVWAAIARKRADDPAYDAAFRNLRAHTK